MKKVLSSVGILFFLVALGSVAALVYFKTDLINPKVKPREYPDAQIPVSNITRDDVWLENFGVDSKDSFQYPATELFVKFDFLNGDEQDVMRSIEITGLDEYKYFCVSQVLKQNRLDSTYYKSGNMLKLLVFINDKTKLERLLTDLKYYRIQYVLK